MEALRRKGQKAEAHLRRNPIVIIPVYTLPYYRRRSRKEIFSCTLTTVHDVMFSVIKIKSADVLCTRKHIIFMWRHFTISFKRMEKSFMDT